MCAPIKLNFSFCKRKPLFDALFRYHQHLCLEAWHINSAHAPLNRDDGGLLPDAYLHLVRKKAAN